MFRNRNQRIRFTPGNGDHIRLRCRVSLYEGRGEFQLIVEHMEQTGAGALQAAFEKLKAKLLAEGLFDTDRKQPLPESVSHLGVITSPTGAAIHDILTVLKRRCPAIEVSILPVAVQGDGAAADIASAIEKANRWHSEEKIQLDALIVGRGGGSLEDLRAFNEEIVARAIAASQLPIVSAVGHEVDFSIADMAADHRAPTPSAAAELLSPDQRELQQRLQKLEADLVRLIRRKLSDANTQLEHLRKRLKHPGGPVAGAIATPGRPGTAPDPGAEKPASPSPRRTRPAGEPPAGQLSPAPHPADATGCRQPATATRSRHAGKAAGCRQSVGAFGADAGFFESAGHLAEGLCHCDR